MYDKDFDQYIDGDDSIIFGDKVIEDKIQVMSRKTKQPNSVDGVVDK